MLDGRLDCSTQNLRLPVASISSFITFESIKNDDLSKGRIFIIGGGIVGCALAFYLSEPSANPSQPEIVVLDKSLTSLMSSTRSGAPGFVGQLNASKVLTKLAMSKYQKIPGAFDGVGGMEIASTPPGAEMLRERLKYAQEAGLPAELISPDFVKPESVMEALYFNIRWNCRSNMYTGFFFRQGAQKQGVHFVEASVDALGTEDGVVTKISTSKGAIPLSSSSTAIVATGIWTQSLLRNSKQGSSKGMETSITSAPVPIVPVAHPYTFTQPRPVLPRATAYPFVRWPEEHVYVRDHGDRDGMGCHNHIPVKVDFPFNSAVADLAATDFAEKLERGCRACLKNSDKFMTGKMEEGKASTTKNLWLCAAIWITHAAGTAKLIARQVISKEDGLSGAVGEDNEEILEALHPDRFRNGNPEVLTRQALGRYNDIYNSQPV